MNNRNREHIFAHMSWWIPVSLFIVAWPFGLALTVVKLIDQKAEDNENRSQQNWYNRMYGGSRYAGGTAQNYTPQGSAWRPAGQNYTAPQQTYAAPQASGRPAAGASPYAGIAAQQQKSALRRRWMVAALIGVGVITILSSFSGLSLAFSDLAMGMFDAYTVRYMLMPALLKLAGGIGLTICGGNVSRGLREEKLLTTIVGARDNVSLRELSDASGYSPKKTQQRLQEAIQHGMFGPAAYLDMRTSTLVVRGAAPAPAPRPAPRPAAAPAPAPQKAPEENKYQKILRELRELNDAIPGEAMSAKISQLEAISARIFALAEKDPSKLPQLTRFMDYYLPTALKLLNTYATLDSQGVSGENISETKANIENTMDLLVQAFEKQLDKLFANDALDVSGDIAALHSMMDLDGLTNASDFPAAQTGSRAPQAPPSPRV